MSEQNEIVPTPCVHGYKAELRQHPTRPLGWVVPVPRDCPICRDTPSGAAFFAGGPDLRMRANPLPADYTAEFNAWSKVPYVEPAEPVGVLQGPPGQGKALLQQGLCEAFPA